MELAFQLANGVTINMNVQITLTKEIANLDVVQESSVAQLASASAKAGSVIVMLIVVMEAMKMIVVSSS